MSNYNRNRYQLPDPICRHVRKGRVTSAIFDVTGNVDLTHSHASTSVCGRPACIEDAKKWAYANTHIEPVHQPDPPEVLARIASQHRASRKQSANEIPQ